MLLDDVMSELDRERRAALVELLAEDGGQALITTTDLDHVPGRSRRASRGSPCTPGTSPTDVTADAVAR